MCLASPLASGSFPGNNDNIAVDDYNGDGRSDVLFKIGNNTHRLFLAQPDGAGGVSFSRRDISF